MATEGAANHLTVLVADDDPRIRQVLRINLKKRNYVVHEAENGRQVIELLAHERPDLIILDLGMPVMNGTEVCDWIRQRHIDVPIMILTAYSEQDLKIRVLEAGADDFMLKPFKVEELLARAHALMWRSAVS